MFTIDAHLDIAMNAIEWNRDYTKTVAEIREREKGMTDKRDRGNNTVSLPELRKGNIGLVVATQIGRFVEKGVKMDGWHSPAQAWAMTQAQYAWYKAMDDLGEMKQIRNLDELEKHLALWFNTEISNENKPIGFILSLEGADSLINLSYLEKAYNYGLRAIGPAHYGPGRYAYGTSMIEGFTPMGKDLLREMDSLNMILDVTHLTDEGFKEAMDIYKGSVWASHHNVRALVPRQRQLADDQIKVLIERGAVIGGALDAWMLHKDFIQRQSDPVALGVKMENLIDHFDHICQIAGNSHHVAFGTDLDGMFGTEHGASDLDTITDLQKYPDLLRKRGYSQEDIENIFYKNWLRFIRKAWKQKP